MMVVKFLRPYFFLLASFHLPLPSQLCPVSPRPAPAGLTLPGMHSHSRTGDITPGLHSGLNTSCPLQTAALSHAGTVMYLQQNILYWGPGSPPHSSTYQHPGREESTDL